MRVLETPGVYFQHTDASAGGISPLRTDIAGFAGIARRGPLHLAVPLESWRQYQAWFGDPPDNGYLADCLRAFFENGGRRAWAVRVASEAAEPATLRLAGTDGNPVWRIEASSPGAWGNDLAVRVREVRRAQVGGLRDALAPARVRVDSLAGFAPHVLVEVIQGAAAATATVVEVDAAASALTLDRPLAAFSAAAPLRVEAIAYALEAYERGRLLALFDDLSLVPAHARYAPAVLAQPWQAIDRHHPEREPEGAASEGAIRFFREARGRIPEPPPPVVVRELRPAAALASPTRLQLDPLAQPTRLAGGADGLAALSVSDFVGEPSSALDSDVARAAARRGLRALDVVDEVALLAAPDIHVQPRAPLRVHLPPPCAPDPCRPQPPQPPAVHAAAVGDVPPRFGRDAIHRVQAAMVELCERRRDRIALLDPPFDACVSATRLAAELRDWRARFDSAFATLYAPWIGVVDTAPAARAAGRLTRPIPPSGHVAGLFAATDLARGVHVAPANVPIEWAQAATLAIDDERHGVLNALGINAIRAQPGRGLRLMGARTLSSDTQWRFVTVRRLVCMIRKALDASLQWAVFEPNDWRTRAKVALGIGSFLQELWSRGALAGATPAAAYAVRCTDLENPAEARARGELLAYVAIAPSVPFEFVVLRIGRESNGLALTEAGSAGG